MPAESAGTARDEPVLAAVVGFEWRPGQASRTVANLRKTQREPAVESRDFFQLLVIHRFPHVVRGRRSGACHRMLDCRHFLRLPPGNAKETGGTSSAALPQYRNHPRAAAQRRRRAHAAEHGRPLVVPVDARRVPRYPALRGPAPPHGRLARHAHGTPECAGRAGHALSQPLWQRAEPARVPADRKRPRVLPRRAVSCGSGKATGAASSACRRDSSTPRAARR